MKTLDMQMALADGDNLYHYSAYWGTWSRILDVRDMGGYAQFTEIGLTPINGWGSHDGVSEVRRQRIRVHATAPGKRDRITRDIPPDVVAAIEARLGEDMTIRLLDHRYV